MAAAVRTLGFERVNACACELWTGEGQQRRAQQRSAVRDHHRVRFAGGKKVKEKWGERHFPSQIVEGTELLAVVARAH